MSAMRDPTSRAVLEALVALGEPDGCMINIGEVQAHVQQAGANVSAEQLRAILARFDDSNMIALGGTRHVNSAAVEVRGEQTITWISPIVFEVMEEERQGGAK